MNYVDFLHAAIDDAIEAARHDYLKPNQKIKLDGSIAGLEECRNKTPNEISTLFRQAEKRSLQALREQAADYWYWRARHAEIEWITNVLSAALLNQKLPIIGTITANGMMQAAKILGDRTLEQSP